MSVMVGTSTGLGTDGKAGSRKGGTSIPFWGCGEETGMWSHMGGTDNGLQGGRRLGCWLCTRRGRTEAMGRREARGRCFRRDVV